MAAPPEDIDLYARLYVELELEIYESAGAIGAPGTPTLQAAREGLENRWGALSHAKQAQLGSRILAFRKAFKSFRDAERHFNYAARYRGAEDDFMEEGEADWRPGFAVFDDKAHKLLVESRGLAARIKAVITARKEGPEDPGTIALTRLWEKSNDHAVELASDRMTMHVNMQDAATARIALLEKERRKRTRPLEAKPKEPPGEPVCRPDLLTGTASDTTGDEELGPAWHGRLELGRGSYGQAYLWLKTDARGRILHRVVQKVTDLSPMWSKTVWWTNGAPGTWGIHRQTLPNEIQAHLDLARKPGSNNIVELLNYNLRLADCAADLYLEFCPFGDAYELLKRGAYNSNDHGDRIKYPFEDHRADSKFIPEQFCWSAFYSLVLGGLLMGNGTIDTSPEAAIDPRRNVIVHRDLKLDNIFLGVPSSSSNNPTEGTSSNGHYPHVKIGDFGGAIFTPLFSPDPRQPEDLMTLYTPDHAAPEMECALKMGRRGNERSVPQSSKTNVWGVGIVLYSLLAGTHGPCHPFQYPKGYFDYTCPSRREPPDFDESACMEYSDELRNLVMACLRYDDRDRPTFEFLEREIRRCVQLRGEGVGEALDLRADGYPVGLALRDVEWWVRGEDEVSVSDKLVGMAI